MKSLSVLGTNSDAGKSWLATGFCALLKRQGFNVAPFKAQNMSNNACATWAGGEIGRAQAVQAEACGRRPIGEMNPILLKPSGESKSQIVFCGIPGPYIEAGKYYEEIDLLWGKITEILDWWKHQCDVLLIEGAGSPVELNLMKHDLANLRPLEYTDGRWLLACDIERGGVFAQGIGTVQLMPKPARERGLGLIINKFRGDMKLFGEAEALFAKHIDIPMLGTLPICHGLQPEPEDSFSSPPETGHQGDPLICWISFPYASNTSDAAPWTLDTGIRMEWTVHPDILRQARIILLPGSKNTLEDLRWLREQGLDTAIQERAAAGVPVVGICGGYQMLGRQITDPEGIAGSAGTMEGLNLLPLKTTYAPEKCVRQVNARWNETEWTTYEIHMGHTQFTDEVTPLLHINEQPEGVRLNNIWGTYLHGFFEVPEVRRALAREAGIEGHQASDKNWQTHKQDIYHQIADCIEEHLCLDSVFAYLDK